MKLDKEDIDLMERFLMPRREMPRLLKEHDEDVAEKVALRLEPRLISIEASMVDLKETVNLHQENLGSGEERFKDLDTRVTKIECRPPNGGETPEWVKLAKKYGLPTTGIGIILTIITLITYCITGGVLP